MTLTQREELLLLLEERDRGEATRESLETLVERLNLLVTDKAALEILADPELDNDEIANQLIGYEERDA